MNPSVIDSLSRSPALSFPSGRSFVEVKALHEEQGQQIASEDQPDIQPRGQEEGLSPRLTELRQRGIHPNSRHRHRQGEGVELLYQSRHLTIEVLQGGALC